MVDGAIPRPPAEGARPTDPAYQLSEVGLALLSKLSTCTFPYGARLLHEHLVSEGFGVSEASVSRLLIELDRAGLTERAGSKGRLASPAGRKLVTAITEGRAREERYARALDINTIEQIFDLLYARRGVETESARAAALHAREEDVAELQLTVREYRGSVSSGHPGRLCTLGFHRAIAKISGNSLLETISGTILNEQLDYLHDVLDVVTAANAADDRSVEEHAAICEAIESRDPDGAAKAMHHHLSRLIQEVETFASGDHAGVLEKVLDLATP